MIKRYCDKCGDLITDESKISGVMSLSTDITLDQLELSTLRVKIVPANDTVWSGHDICKYCVLDKVAGLDDRPKAI